METVNADDFKVRKGRVFKAYRIKAEITQRVLSAETGIPLSMIREYEQDRCEPGADRLIILVTRLGIPMAELSPAVASSEDSTC